MIIYVGSEKSFLVKVAPGKTGDLHTVLADNVSVESGVLICERYGRVAVAFGVGQWIYIEPRTKVEP